MTPGQRGPEWGCYLGGETVEALFLGTAETARHTSSVAFIDEAGEVGVALSRLSR